MTACPRCSQIFDEKKLQACPNCFAPLAAPPVPAMPAMPPTPPDAPGNYGTAGYVSPPLPNPNVRVSLTGEVFETPALSASPVYTPPAGYPPSAYPPLPPPNYSALPPLLPRVPRAEQNWLVGIGVTVAVVLLAGICFGVTKARQYQTGETAFEREAHLDLSTPQSTAKEALHCIQAQSWARFYLLSSFSGTTIRSLEKAESFARGVHAGGQDNPSGMSIFIEAYSSMTDIQAATPQIHGQRADVPVSAMLHFRGKNVPLVGVAHLVNDDENKWRLDFTMVGQNFDTPQDKAALAKALQDLLGLQIPQGAPAINANAAPAPVQPMFTYPPGFGPENNNPLYRQRMRRRGPNYPYPPNVPQPGNPAPAPTPTPQNPQPGTPAPSSPTPTPPAQPTPTNPSGPAPSDPKPSDPSDPNPNPSTPPATPNGRDGGSPK